MIRFFGKLSVMQNNQNRIGQGRQELKETMALSRSLFWTAGFFSIFVNLLMLTGPLFMLQVYDRVLASGSIPTLVVLFGLVVILYATMGILDFTRQRILARAGARFRDALDTRVFDAVLRRSVIPSERNKPMAGNPDLDSIQRFMSSPAPFAIFDAPWAPLFLGLIFMFHWTLGVLALVGGLTLFLLTLINHRISRNPESESQKAAALSAKFSESLRRDAESIQALGMRKSAINRWSVFRDQSLKSQIQSTDRSGGLSTISKTLRFFLQSAVLGLGAALAVEGIISPGVMIAASILLGRALAPVEAAISQWAMFLAAKRGYAAIAELLETTPAKPAKMNLRAPKGDISVHHVAVGPPGVNIPTLRGITFTANPGDVIGVIGPSGAGKSTLARVIAGIWPAMSGKVKLDGAALNQWDDEALGRYIGYLPQDIMLFDGTIEENIARLSIEPNTDAVLKAAELSGAHELILALPQGYKTPVGENGAQLSGGQRQRIALARALYGDPALVILDEPNAHLDHQGSVALIQAIKQLKLTKQTVLLMAHRPSAIEACDKLLVIDKGQQIAFGDRDEVLKKTTSNAPQLIKGGAKK